MTGQERHEKMMEVVRREQAAQAQRDLEASIAEGMLASQQSAPAAPTSDTKMRDRVEARLQAEYV